MALSAADFRTEITVSGLRRLCPAQGQYQMQEKETKHVPT